MKTKLSGATIIVNRASTVSHKSKRTPFIPQANLQLLLLLQLLQLVVSPDIFSVDKHLRERALSALLAHLLAGFLVAGYVHLLKVHVLGLKEPFHALLILFRLGAGRHGCEINDNLGHDADYQGAIATPI